MTDRRVAIRFGTEGKAQVVGDLNDIGTTGDAAYNRVARAAIKAGQDATQAIEAADRSARKLATLMPGLNPTKLDMYAGVQEATRKSAEQSAAVFSAAYSQMEKRAEALRLAIDPVYAAQQRFDREMAEARTLISAGALSLDDYVAKLRFEKSALDSVSQAHGRVGTSSGAMRMAMAGASFQVQDFVTQVSMGANPVQAFVVQGGQLAGQFMFVEGAAGKVARFLMGPWGLAMQIGLMALAPVIAKLWEGGEASKAAAKAAEEHRKAVLVLAEAQGKAIQTAERKQALDVAQIKIDLDAAVAARSRAQAEMERARAGLAALNQPGMEAERGIGVQRSALQSRIDDLTAAMTANSAEIEKLQRGFDQGFARMVNQRAESGSTPEGRINAKYRDLIAQAMTDLAGVANGPKLRAKLDELYAARDKELESIKKSTAARDQDTLTAAQVSKMLRDTLPGVHITSTTGGQHVKNSYHYRNQAVDFVPAGGVNSMTKADVRRIFESRGIDVVELLGPGDAGHSDHFHVAWTKGKESLAEFNDAAKRAQQEAREAAAAQRQLASDLLSVTKALDPAQTAANDYADTLATIAKAQAASLISYADGVDLSLKAFFKEQERQAEESSKRIKALFGSDDPLKGVVQEDATKIEVEQWEAHRKKGQETIRSLSDFYQNVFTGGSDFIWSAFKQFGIKTISDLLAKWTLGAGGDGAGGLLGSIGKLFGGASGILPGELSIPSAGDIFGPSTNPITAFASGTESAPGGLALVGEEGPEIMSVPRGSRVSTAAETRRLLGGANDNASAAPVVNIYADRAVLAEEVRGWVADGIAIASARGAAGGAALAASNAAQRKRRMLA